MRFTIEHHSSYRYSVPVTLGQHRLRLLPRRDPGQQVHRYDLRLTPEPVTVSEGQDTWGNRVHEVTFAGSTSALEVRVEMEVETLADQPPPLPDGPLPPAVPMALSPYLASLDRPEVLEPFVAPVRQAANGHAGRFLDELARSINRYYHRGIRVEGEAWSPGETIARGGGVCRDLTVLFMAACRHEGIPARFVSGYQSGDATREARYMHAWPEVWLPECGWYGIDPTHALPVADCHVALAAAPVAGDTTPIAGSFTFLGETVTSTLDVDLRITAR